MILYPPECELDKNLSFSANRGFFIYNNRSEICSIEKIEIRTINHYEIIFNEKIFIGKKATGSFVISDSFKINGDDFRFVIGFKSRCLNEEDTNLYEFIADIIITQFIFKQYFTCDFICSGSPLIK